MIHGQDFDSYLRSCEAGRKIMWCYACDRTYTEGTWAKMDDRSVPCACGVQPDDLTPLNDRAAQRAAENVTSWDRLVELISDSGMWRCDSCYLIAPEDGWLRQGFKDESFVTCPRCGQVEDYEVLKVDNGGDGLDHLK